MLPFSFDNKDAERAYRDLMQAIQDNDGVECAQLPDIFFPEEWAKSTHADILLAKTVCGRCPVKTQCLEYAMTEDEHGLWAGLTAHERRQLRSLSKR